MTITILCPCLLPARWSVWLMYMCVQLSTINRSAQHGHWTRLIRLWTPCTLVKRDTFKRNVISKFHFQFIQSINLLFFVRFFRTFLYISLLLHLTAYNDKRRVFMCIKMFTASCVHLSILFCSCIPSSTYFVNHRKMIFYFLHNITWSIHSKNLR